MPADLDPGIKSGTGAIEKTQTAKDALTALLPIGLGQHGGEFDKVFMDTFQLIVLRGQKPRAVLERHGVPSFDPGRPEFEPQRYWRGPVWLIVNWMLIDGLRRNGRPGLAERIRRDSLALVERSGFAEYFDPLNGAPLGGSRFSWTAATYLHLAAD